MRMKLGYLSLAKGSWINDRLERQRQNSLDSLQSLDAEIVDCGMLVQTEADADSVLRSFQAKGIDAVIAHFITFPLGSIVPRVATSLRVPVLLWAEPEPPMDGGRLAANSFCAANMNAHALYRMNLEYAFVYGKPDKAVNEISSYIKALACVNSLKEFRIGSLGGRVPGFYTSNFNELRLRERFGVEVESVTLLELVQLGKTIQGDPVRQAVDEIVARGNHSDVSDDELNLAGALLAAFRQLQEKYRLDAWAVRCWPEFGDLYGIGVCRILGCMTEQGTPTACEGDVYGALAMQVGTFLTGSPAFFCDLISFDDDGDTGVFWHCGAAPDGLCRTGCQVSLCKHSIMDGGGVKGITGEFPLKSGQVTVLRIGEDRNGAYRILAIEAEGLDTDQLLKGNPLKVRFNRPARAVVQELIDNGIEHHYILVYGNVVPELRVLAKLLGIEMMEL